MRHNLPPGAGLDKTDDRMRKIRLLQRGNLVGGEFHVHGCESVIEMVQLGGADDRRRDDRLGEQPRQRHLRPRNAPCRGNLGHAIDNLAVCLGGFCEEPLVSVVGLGPDARVVPIPGQPPASLRAPRNDADPFGRAKRQHFPLLLAVDTRFCMLTKRAQPWRSETPRARANCHACIEDAPM